MVAGTPLPLVAQIKRAVAAEYGVALAVMDEPNSAPGARLREHAHPRQIAICLSTRLTDHSYVRIGQFFGGRDHSTVISSCASVEKRRLTDPKLHNAMRRLTLELVRG
jgi:chromosomal replication initiation ATPase DnaA